MSNLHYALSSLNDMNKYINIYRVKPCKMLSPDALGNTLWRNHYSTYYDGKSHTCRYIISKEECLKIPAQKRWPTSPV